MKHLPFEIADKAEAKLSGAQDWCLVVAVMICAGFA